MSPLERRLVRAQLDQALAGVAHEVETDPDGDLLISVDFADGRLSASIASLDCPLLRILAVNRKIGN